MNGSEKRAHAYRAAVSAARIGDDPEIATLTALLARRVSETPQAEFLRFGDESWSFAQVDAWSSEVAHRLSQLDGFATGDRLAIMLPNVVQWPVVWLAALKAGAITVPINPAYRKADLEHVLLDSGARVVVTDLERSELVKSVVAGDPQLAGTQVVTEIDALAGDGRGGFPPFSAEASTLANLQYTSGTTGFPKACMLTHDYWVRLAWICAAATGLGPDDVLLTAQPFSYMDPQWNTALALTTGAPLVVLPRFSASGFMGDVSRHGVTFFYVLGSMPTLLLKQPPSEHDLDNDLRMVFCSGIPSALHAELEQRWGAPWREIYGMTETGVDLFTPFGDTESVGSGAVGQPVPTKVLRVVDADGRDVASGEPGEMLVQGRPLMDGYWGRPDDTESVLSDGWLRTGDVVVQDHCGRVTIVGRVKDMVRRGGENVASVEVEATLERDARVLGAAVVAVDDEVLGEEVKAFVELAEGLEPTRLTAESIRAGAGQHLARFKVPRFIEFVDHLPRTPSERVAKATLKAQAGDRQGVEFDFSERAAHASDALSSDRDGVRVSVVDEVAVVTLSRPAKLNALDVATRLRLANVVRELGAGLHVRGIVLTGDGRAFSAGEDLSVTIATDDQFAEAFESFHDITRAILTTRVPVVAAINGIAVGGASEITLCCDSRIGTSKAEYFQPENARGLTISNASSILLQRLVGSHAMRMVLGSERVNAEEALRIGLLDDIVDDDRLVESAVDVARRWNPPGSMTALHLPLLRPQLEDIESAFAREDVAGHEAWSSGALSAGVATYWAANTSTERTPGEPT
ncbi:AMP-binding protein [Aeromicrobium sp. Leaf350]|uniref:AMP-binding protein n=1 Tax=Aeromicrobium sp. Leaf350 TaxID=2876565 RepID=UPI001E3C4715|nr:AMP-binding protein [Aeromicrobium sp. Leaf350]